MIADALAAAAVTIGVAALSVCVAHANPSKFPDLGGYQPVDAGDYALDTTTPGIPSNQVFFITPDGLPCSFQSGTAGCIGKNIPAIPDKDKTPYTYVGTAGGIHAAGSTPFVNDMVRGQPLRTLPPFHSITFEGATCGVDDSGTTACKDSRGRGFILSPSWSGWLPTV